MWISVLIVATIFISLEVIGGSAARNPGLKTHITAAGLNYANEVATDILTKSLKGTSIPDQSGQSGDVSYSVSQLLITEFTKPTSSIKLAPPGGLAWHASNINIGLHGNFEYIFKKIIRIKDHGSFDVRVGGMAFGLDLLIGTDENGRPTIKTSGCTSYIVTVDLKFHGGRAWIYNLFRHKVADVIKNMLNKKLCNMIENMVNIDGGKAMAKLKVMTKIGHKFLLDYRLLKPPVFTSEYLETTHKGEVYWTSAVKDVPLDATDFQNVGESSRMIYISTPDYVVNSIVYQAQKHDFLAFNETAKDGDVYWTSADLPFKATDFPNVEDSSRMFYIWLSDYVINSMLYRAQKHGFLTFNMTAKDLPAGIRSLLATTCDQSPCIGTHIPNLKSLPGYEVELQMKSNFVPNISIVNGEIKARAGGDITLLAACPKLKDLKFFFTLNVNGTADVSLNVKGQLVHFKMRDMKLQMKVTKSDIQGLSDLSLQLLNTIIQEFVLMKINELGDKGFPLPLTDEIQLINTSLLLKQGTLLIATDVKYG